MIGSRFLFIAGLSASLLTVSPSAYAKKVSISKLKDKIANQSTAISKLAGEIRSLEKDIVLKNENYLERVKLVENLEKEIYTVKDNLMVERRNLDDSYLVISDSIERYLLEADDDESDESLEKRRLYLSLLEAKKRELTNKLRLSKQLEKKLDKFTKRVISQKESERVLYNVIIDLEKKKKTLSQNYISTLEKKNNNQELLDKAISKRKAYRKTYNKRAKKKARLAARRKGAKPDFLMGLILPAENIIDIKKGKKKRSGIYLKFKDSLPVKAPMDGQIEYAGELAAYGNVLMINHGKDVRSVLMGDIKIKLKKGDFVKKDQLLGYTVSDTGVNKSLYYEVRKKNKVQNTIKWLAKDSTGRIKI